MKRAINNKKEKKENDHQIYGQLPTSKGIDIYISVQCTYMLFSKEFLMISPCFECTFDICIADHHKKAIFKYKWERPSYDIIVFIMSMFAPVLCCSWMYIYTFSATHARLDNNKWQTREKVTGLFREKTTPTMTQVNN